MPETFDSSLLSPIIISLKARCKLLQAIPAVIANSWFTLTPLRGAA